MVSVRTRSECVFFIVYLILFSNQLLKIAEYGHRLNIELDLLCTAALIGWDPATPPPPLAPLLGSYTRALLISQDRRHLFVTPWLRVFVQDITSGILCLPRVATTITSRWATGWCTATCFRTPSSYQSRNSGRLKFFTLTLLVFS